MPEAQRYVLIHRGEKVHSLDHITTREEKGGKEKHPAASKHNSARNKPAEAQSARVWQELPAGI